MPDINADTEIDPLGLGGKALEQFCRRVRARTFARRGEGLPYIECSYRQFRILKHTIDMGMRSPLASWAILIHVPSQEGE
jgi:hypothetical protein